MLSILRRSSVSLLRQRRIAKESKSNIIHTPVFRVQNLDEQINSNSNTVVRVSRMGVQHDVRPIENDKPEKERNVKSNR
jgi:hypothetical protein